MRTLSFGRFLPSLFCLMVIGIGCGGDSDIVDGERCLESSECGGREICVVESEKTIGHCVLPCTGSPCENGAYCGPTDEDRVRVCYSVGAAKLDEACFSELDCDSGLVCIRDGLAPSGKCKFACGSHAAVEGCSTGESCTDYDQGGQTIQFCAGANE